MNDLWALEVGWLAGFTQDKELQRRIKRYKSWRIMAEYTDRNGKRAALQYRIPIAERRSAERMLNVKVK